MARFPWQKQRRLNEDDFQDEIRAHLAMAADERVANGANRESARLASIKDFGNVTHTVEAARSVWTPWWMEGLRDWFSDVRYAIRGLARNPVFSITVIAVLTLGIGLNAAVFTFLKGLALSPLSGVEGSGHLAVVLTETSAGRKDGLSYRDYQYLRDHDRAFNGLVGSGFSGVNLGLGNRARPIMGELVTGNYFDVLGVRAQLGRTLLPSDEGAPGSSPVVVLSDGLWRRDFDADPAIVGKTIHLNTFPLTVVGVADAAFHGTIVSFDIEVFAPIVMAQQLGLPFLAQGGDMPSALSATSLMVLGHLRPGTTLANANEHIATIEKTLKRERAAADTSFNLRVIPIWESPYGAQTYMLPAIIVLSAMAALLLLIVCANIAGLVLVRGIARRGEVALRLAVGATRTRIVRLLLIENLVLAVPGAIGGVVLVWVGLPLLWSETMAAAPGRIFLNVAIDRLVIGFSMLAACVSALTFGCMPAFRGSRIDLVSVINEDLSPRAGGRGRFRSALVIAQVAVSLLLLVSAGLVARSLDAARTADAGFDPTDAISVTVNLKPNGYDETAGLAFFEQLLVAVRTGRAVESASLAAVSPMTVIDSDSQLVSIEGYEPRRDEDLAFLTNTVGAEYFRTLKIGLVAGREFETRDDAAAVPVVIVNETLARRFWGEPAQAIGQRVKISTGDWRTVIGVARDVKYARVNEDPRPYVYLPFLQAYRSTMTLHARGSAGASALIEQARAHIQALDADLPILYARSLREQTASSLAVLEMVSTMLFGFGLAGMMLAALGIYGLVSYTVTESTHEIGVRMALGARGLALVGGFVGRGVRLGATGAVIGIVAAFAVTRFLSSVLYGVSATDVISFGRALALVMGVVIVATLIPAWRAGRTNPLAALRRM